MVVRSRSIWFACVPVKMSEITPTISGSWAFSILQVLLLVSPNLIFCQQEHLRTCPSQTSRVNGKWDKVVWKAINSNNIIMSNPPCIDNTNKLVTRTCSNHTWIPEADPICEKIIGNHKHCPMHFDETTEHSCVYVSEPTSWNNRCKFDKRPSIYSRVKINGSVWLPLKRNTEFGPYESVTWGKDYGQPLDKSHRLIFNRTDIFSKNCVIIDSITTEMKPVHCNETHSHVCTFNVGDEIHVCPKNCTSAGIGTQNCYCKEYNTRRQDIAEIKSPFDKNILTSFIGEDRCYVSDKHVSPEFKLPGFRQALSRNNWTYTNYKLNCSIRSTSPLDFALADVEMVLNFQEKHKKLILIIYSPIWLFGDGREDYVYCFTDASNELKKRVKVKKVLEHVREVERNYFVYKVSLEKYMGQYWCEAHRKGSFEEPVVSNTVIAYDKKPGNEYALRIVVHEVCSRDCPDETDIEYLRLIPKSITNTFEHLDAEFRVMQVFDVNFDTGKLDILLHISTGRKRDVIVEFYKCKSRLETISGNVSITYFRSSEFCMPEEDYSMQNEVSWPLTNIGQGVVPNEFCLQENYLPIYRVCGGNFLYGAEWSSVNGECRYNQVSENTRYMHSMTKKNLTQSLVNNVSQILKNDEELSVLDVYFMSVILDNICKMGENRSAYIKDTLEITNSLLDLQPQTYVEAQNMLNTTDGLLDAIDNIFSVTKFESDVLLVQEKNVILHVTNPFVSFVSGLVIYSDENDNINVKNFDRYNTFDDLKFKRNVYMAVYVPEEILLKFQNENLTNIYVVITIYLNDRFFVSNFKKSAGPIVSVTIPEYDSYLPSTLPILFKTSENQHSPVCAFWDYGKNTRRKKGNWSTIGGNYVGHFNNISSFHICSFSHLTHFSLLIDGSVTEILSETNDFILNIIIFIGDTLSIIGISGIFVTAVVFKKWRKKPGTKILLNLCIAISFEIIAIHIPEMNDSTSQSACQLVGIILHYSVLSKYCWMLVYAFLQYMRFVKVLGPLPNNIVLKSVLFGWGAPIIPVSLLNWLKHDCYSSNKYDYCYPTGLPFYLTVVLPVVTISLVNLFVFYIVMRQVSTKTIDSYPRKSDTGKLQLQLATLLFFVLGIPILIGQLSKIIAITWLQVTFIYLFSISANIQGFILFLFYVVFNKETRLDWTNFIWKIERGSGSALTSKT